MDKYYKVSCKCGHVGRSNYIIVVFALKAKNGKEASLKARWLPRVKHNQRDAILSCCEIEKYEYEQILQKNKNEPYLRCANRQEQNALDLSKRLNKEPSKKQYRCKNDNICKKLIKRKVENREFDNEITEILISRD